MALFPVSSSTENSGNATLLEVCSNAQNSENYDEIFYYCDGNCENDFRSEIKSWYKKYRPTVECITALLTI